MVDRALLTAELGELADRIQRVRIHCPARLPELVADRDAFELVSFNLMLALQACADLRAGKVHETWHGLSWCRFECGVSDMGYRDLTDGRWVWPEGLAHYVEHHGLPPHDELLKTVRSGARPRAAGAEREIDKSFWNSWYARCCGGARRRPW